MNEQYIPLINQFVPLNLRALISPHLFSPETTSQTWCNMPRKFIPGMEEQRQKVGGTNWLINTLIYEILCQKVIIFYRQKLASLFQKQEKLKAFSVSKWNFSDSCFIADDILVKIVWLHVLVFSEHILHFRDLVHLL